MNEKIIRKNVKQKNDILKVYNENRIKIHNWLLEHHKKPFIKKSSYEILKKIKDKLELKDNIILNPLTDKGKVRIHYMSINCNYGSLYLVVSLCYWDGRDEAYNNRTNYTEYYEESFYLGYIPSETQILDERRELEKKEYIDPVKELKAVLKAEKLKEEFNTARDKISCAINKKYL